jgi:hypothetical protein
MPYDHQLQRRGCPDAIRKYTMIAQDILGAYFIIDSLVFYFCI